MSQTEPIGEKVLQVYESVSRLLASGTLVPSPGHPNLDVELPEGFQDGLLRHHEAVRRIVRRSYSEST